MQSARARARASPAGAAAIRSRAHTWADQVGAPWQESRPFNHTQCEATGVGSLSRPSCDWQKKVLPGSPQLHEVLHKQSAATYQGCGTISWPLTAAFMQGCTLRCCSWTARLRHSWRSGWSVRCAPIVAGRKKRPPPPPARRTAAARRKLALARRQKECRRTTSVGPPA